LLRRAAKKSIIHGHHPLMPEMSLRDLQPEIPRSASPQSSNSTRGLHPPLRASWGVGADACIPPVMSNSCSPRWGLNGVYVARMRDCEGLTCDGELAAVAPRVEPSPRTQPTPGVQTLYPMSRELGLKLCPLHLYGVRLDVLQNPEKHGMSGRGGYDLVHIQCAYGAVGSIQAPLIHTFGTAAG
jgi:hypothetical protein